jgi:hypothetical protein
MHTPANSRYNTNLASEPLIETNPYTDQLVRQVVEAGRMVKKLVPVAPEQELIAQRPLKIKQAREVFCQGRVPASLI